MSGASSNVSCPDFSNLFDDSNNSFIGPPVKPNPDVSGLGVTLPFHFMLWTESVP